MLKNTLSVCMLIVLVLSVQNQLYITAFLKVLLTGEAAVMKT